MIDYHKQIKTALETILPTHYEMFLHSGLETPCISYMELSNYTQENGETIAYSRISYQVKVWGKDIAELQRYSLAIDAALRQLDFKRTSSGELYDNNSTMIQKIMTYETFVKEEY